MAEGYRGQKTEHAGHKGSTSSSGFSGKRAEAKFTSNIKRRAQDKREERCYESDYGEPLGYPGASEGDSDER